MISFFNKIVDTLDELQIPYMLSGSVAMSVYVVPRSTRGFDFVIHLENKNIELFAKSFEKGFYCNINSIIDAVKRHSIFNIIDHASGYKADFVILKNELFRLEEFKRKRRINFMNREINIVSLEDLIISKIIWIQTYQSAIQIEDIKLLLQSEKVDTNYIKYWIKELKIHTFNLM